MLQDAVKSHTNLIDIKNTNHRDKIKELDEENKQLKVSINISFQLFMYIIFFFVVFILGKIRICRYVKHIIIILFFDLIFNLYSVQQRT